jgi:hypothetical protein
MEILIRDGVRNQDILALPANSAEKLDSREGIRQFMAGDVFTLTAGMALKALFEIRDEARRQAVRQEFARFFDKLAEAGVISSENKEEVVSKTIDTAAFDLPAMVPMQEARRIEVNADIQRATQALADLGV